MRKFKIGAAVAMLLVVVCFVAAFSIPSTRLFFRRGAVAQTVDATPIDIAVFQVPDNSVMHVQVRISAFELATGEARSWNA